MSQRVIDDPELAGWELNPDTGYWMWKGEEGTGGLWEQNGDDIYYDKGNVITSENLLVQNKAGGVGAKSEITFVNSDAVTGQSGRASIVAERVADASGGYDGSTITLSTTNGGVTAETNKAMTIGADGDVTLAHPAGLYGRRTSNDLALKLIGYVPGTDNVELVASSLWSVKDGNGNTLLKVNANDGRVDVTGSLYVNGSEVGSGGGGLPDGDYTHNGKITATDFISTSDERLKENITPMPIGLIDDIKPVSWDWKDGSGPSAGVVAQQLQAVGLGDYVSEDEDGQLGVNYQALTAILLAEVIELKRSLK